jgi:hypothetical protein
METKATEARYKYLETGEVVNSEKGSKARTIQNRKNLIMPGHFKKPYKRTTGLRNAMASYTILIAPKGPAGTRPLILYSVITGTMRVAI